MPTCAGACPGKQAGGLAFGPKTGDPSGSPVFFFEITVDSISRLEQQIRFIVEIDKLKSVLRQSYLADDSRRENTAEHSWHVSLMALVLSEHSSEPVDRSHVMELLLVHDLVEIDAGDTFAYDTAGNETKAAREIAAAERIFGLLPDDDGKRLRALWDEYEAGATAEARFALSLDRLMPLIHNALTAGRAWQANGVTADRVEQRAKSISRGAPALGEFAKELIAKAVAVGHLPPSAH